MPQLINRQSQSMIDRIGQDYSSWQLPACLRAKRAWPSSTPFGRALRSVAAARPDARRSCYSSRLMLLPKRAYSTFFSSPCLAAMAVSSACSAASAAAFACARGVEMHYNATRPRVPAHTLRPVPRASPRSGERRPRTSPPHLRFLLNERLRVLGIDINERLANEHPAGARTRRGYREPHSNNAHY